MEGSNLNKEIMRVKRKKRRKEKGKGKNN